MWLCWFRNRQVGILNNIIHPGFQELHYLMFQHSLSMLLSIFKLPLFLKPDLAVAIMWLCQFGIREIENLNNIILSQFCQAAVICETGHGSSRHVAVSVPEPAGRNFK